MSVWTRLQLASRVAPCVCLALLLTGSVMGAEDFKPVPLPNPGIAGFNFP